MPFGRTSTWVVSFFAAGPPVRLITCGVGAWPLAETAIAAPPSRAAVVATARVLRIMSYSFASDWDVRRRRRGRPSGVCDAAAFRTTGHDPPSRAQGAAPPA